MNKKLTRLDDVMLDKLVLATPNGFCAGVEMAERAAHLAIDVLNDMKELGMTKTTTLYLKHQIVHNEDVTDRLLSRGSIVVEDVNDIPKGSYVFFSAHGSSLSDFANAETRGLEIIDGTCNLVTKNHKIMKLYASQGSDIIFIGKESHIEVIGAVGQLPGKKIYVVNNIEQANALDVHKLHNPIYVTQTTLSVQDAKEVTDILEEKGVKAPSSGTICYATHNRQEAIKQALKDHSCQLLLVVGDATSSNANNLVKTGKNAGVENSHLVNSLSAVDYRWFANVSSAAVSSAASTPNESLNLVFDYLARKSQSTRFSNFIEENVKFSLPTKLKEMIIRHPDLYQKYRQFL